MAWLLYGSLRSVGEKSSIVADNRVDMSELLLVYEL